MDHTFMERQGRESLRPAQRRGGRGARRDSVLYGLIALAGLLSVGHHLDHAIRGNHLGWPLTAEVTPFTYSLGVYPLILLGLFLYRSRRVGPGYWALLSGAGVLFVGATHFGPAALEPPADIIALYEPRLIGWFAFAWLVVFVAVLVGLGLYGAYWWSRQRRTRAAR